MGVFLIYNIIYKFRLKLNSPTLFKKDFKLIFTFLLVGIFAFIILSLQFYPVIKQYISPLQSQASAFNRYWRPFRDLFTQSAKPLSYFLPPTTHPIFGRFTEQFIGSPLYGVSYTEHTLYLGWVPLILAFIAFRRWRKNKKNSKREIASSPPLAGTRNDDEKESFYIGFFIWLAIVAWLFSQPPYFNFPHFKVYMPSFFMYRILPMFRAYCRFGVVVMLAVSVLAGFGLKFILERFKSNKVKMVFTSLICGLVLFEFLNFPPFKVIDLTKYPKVYDWLKEEKGDFVIAEYPLDCEGSDNYYKFYQTIHQKRLVNGTNPGTYANKVARTIWKLSAPKTAGILRWMKVKYVLVHLGAYEKSNDMEIVNELRKVKTRRLPGLKLIRSFDDVDVYEVRAKAIEPVKNDYNS